MAALLEVENLGAFYGATQALHALSFSLEEGGITTLLGANGAGKTTTLRAISGLLRTIGEIRFAGGRIDGRKTEDIARCGIAHVPDGRGTFAEFTVEENLRLGALDLADRAYLLETGRVVLSGRATDIKQDTSVRRSYLGY
jgi:branched-chain amino acid transport system ATP-binding protein